MIQRLIILGLLKKSSFSGYGIRKFIDKELGVFVKPQSQSIYYTLRKMEGEGLIKKRESKKNSHFRKYLYAITSKGEKTFLELCKKVLLSQRRPFIELDIALYFLPFINKKEILPLLRLRLRFLESVKKWLIDKEEELKKAPRNLALLIRHHFKLVGAEKDFLEDIIGVVKNEQSSINSCL